MMALPSSVSAVSATASGASLRPVTVTSTKAVEEAPAASVTV